MSQGADQDQAKVILIKFRWTLSEARLALKEECKARRLVERLRFWLVLVVFFGVVAVNDGLDRAIFYSILGACIWLGFRLAARETVAKEFKQSPWQNCDVEWQITDTQFQAAVGTYRFSFGWEWITRLVQRPRGFVLFIGREGLWLPNCGFSSSGDIESLCQLARAKVSTFKSCKKLQK